jgi:hypothetical protein
MSSEESSHARAPSTPADATPSSDGVPNDTPMATASPAVASTGLPPLPASPAANASPLPWSANETLRVALHERDCSPCDGYAGHLGGSSNDPSLQAVYRHLHHDPAARHNAETAALRSSTAELRRTVVRLEAEVVEERRLREIAQAEANGIGRAVAAFEESARRDRERVRADRDRARQQVEELQDTVRSLDEELELVTQEERRARRELRAHTERAGTPAAGDTPRVVAALPARTPAASVRTTPAAPTIELPTPVATPSAAPVSTPVPAPPAPMAVPPSIPPAGDAAPCEGREPKLMSEMAPEELKSFHDEFDAIPDDDDWMFDTQYNAKNQPKKRGWSEVLKHGSRGKSRTDNRPTPDSSTCPATGAPPSTTRGPGNHQASSNPLHAPIWGFRSRSRDHTGRADWQNIRGHWLDASQQDSFACREPLSTTPLYLTLWLILCT